MVVRPGVEASPTAVEAHSVGAKVASEAGRCGSVSNVRGGSAATETAPAKVAGLRNGRGGGEERLGGRGTASATFEAFLFLKVALSRMKLAVWHDSEG